MRVIQRDEGFVAVPGYAISVSSVVRCPNPDAPDAGSLLMATDLADGSDSSVGIPIWRSTDDGETFTREEAVERSYICDFEGSWIKSGYGGLAADERSGAILFLASDTYWHRGGYESIKRCRRIYHRLSFDNGHTWTDKRYIIQQGAGPDGKPYDGDHFLLDAVYGRNMSAIVGPRVIRARDGSLLISVQTQCVDAQGRMIEPSGFGFYKAGALKAWWQADTLEYAFTLDGYAQVDPADSARGVYEPTYAQCPDGRTLMVMRGSNMHFRDTMPGTKFYAYSSDEGRTWTRPERLRYDDGSLMYASSSIPKVLAHSNGKVYYIGIINDENPDGNLPRYPLCIAELDPERPCILRDTVRVIDTERPYHKAQAKETRNIVDFSNHAVFEDARGRIVVLAPFRFDLRRYESVLNRYVLAVD